MQAILLVGGQGTRLRPLTISTPKPMLPVAGYPCTSHQIARAADAGVTRIVLGTSYRAEVFEDYFSQHNEFDMDIHYAVEDEPLGTGGAIRNAAQFLTCGPDDPVIIFNGDILTGLDITGLVERWRESNADVALYLTRVDDPRAYGLVPTDETGRVLAFKEKPTTPEEIVTDQINAGCYVFKRSVIDRIPADRVVSVERETFPELLETDARVIGVVDDGYWLDLGTPLAFSKGSADLVRGIAPSPLLEGSIGDSLVKSGTSVHPSASITAGSYIGNGVSVGENAIIEGSVIYDNATIAAGAQVIRSIVGDSASIGTHARITETVVAEGASLGAHNELNPGARVFPNAVINDSAIRFSSDR